MFIINAAPGTSMAGELFDKVLKNDIKAVKKLLAAGADINKLPGTAAIGEQLFTLRMAMHILLIICICSANFNFIENPP